jgi:hypothetical protein
MTMGIIGGESKSVSEDAAYTTAFLANTSYDSVLLSRSNCWLLLFICNSIVMQMVLGQKDVIAPYSLVYWTLVLPALVIPFWFTGELVEVFKGHGRTLFAFLICAGGFHLVRGDFRTVMQLILLAWVMAWCACDTIRISTADLVKIFFASIVLGVLVGFGTDLNIWSLLPGNTPAEYGAWRVSFFPHVANTGVLALIAFMFLTRDVIIAQSYKIALALCVYFLLFSFVRTVFVAFSLYLVLLVVFKAAHVTRPIALFSGSLFVAVGSNVAEIYTVPILEVLQRYPIISRLFLRGQSGLDPEAIYQQLYRPWLWSEHFSMFASSPDWMGLGTFKFLDHVSYNLVPGLNASGSESFPTRLLAVYGIPTVFFLAYLILELGRRARAKDAWACACFPAVIFMMMNWGSVFHPTNVFFVLFFMLLKGTRALAH